jgi:hypothetical protein
MHGGCLEIMSLQEAIVIVVVSAKASGEPALEEIGQLNHAVINTMAMSKASIAGNAHPLSAGPFKATSAENRDVQYRASSMTLKGLTLRG